MHFLGLNGMARRVPDYPDQYSTIHFICSVGALSSYLSLLYFFFIIYKSFVERYSFLQKEQNDRALLKPIYDETRKLYSSIFDCHQTAYKTKSDFVLGYFNMWHFQDLYALKRKVLISLLIIIEKLKSFYLTLTWKTFFILTRVQFIFRISTETKKVTSLDRALTNPPFLILI